MTLTTLMAIDSLRCLTPNRSSDPWLEFIRQIILDFQIITGLFSLICTFFLFIGNEARRAKSSTFPNASEITDADMGISSKPLVVNCIGFVSRFTSSCGTINNRLVVNGFFFYKINCNE